MSATAACERVVAGVVGPWVGEVFPGCLMVGWVVGLDCLVMVGWVVVPGCLVMGG